MKIYVLNDNASGPGFLATHGLSFYIEADTNVLLDTGPDNTFIENAKRLNIELKPEFIVVSHGHWDHGNGLAFAPAATLVYHPKTFMKRYSKHKNIYVGLNSNDKELEKKFKLLISSGPIKLSESITYLGEIPKTNIFEAKHTDFIDEQGNDDFIPDDSGLAISTDDGGIIVISGCAHSGICNIVDYAMKIKGTTNVKAVFGGFHLKSAGEQTQKTIEYFRSKNITQVFPSHCTSLPALSEFYRVFKLPQVLTGNYYSF